MLDIERTKAIIELQDVTDFGRARAIVIKCDVMQA